MNGLRCREFVELVTAFLDGTLDPGTEGRFAGHLPACEGCRRYLDQIRQTIRALGAPGP
jgi:anti-sigma factor RsiW